MKALNITLSISFVLLLLLNFTSCKKDKTEVVPTVTADDLLAYNLVLTVDLGQNIKTLRLITFSKVGNDVMATLDAITSRRTQTINMLNNSFVFDTNGDGKTVYTLSFAKNSEGEITLNNAKYASSDYPVYKIADAFENKLADLISVKDKTYINNESQALLRFYTDSWVTSSFPDVTGSYYEISTGAWKGKMNNQDYMGISAIKKDLTKYMYIQHGDVLEIYLPN